MPPPSDPLAHVPPTRAIFVMKPVWKLVDGHWRIVDWIADSVVAPKRPSRA